MSTGKLSAIEQWDQVEAAVRTFVEELGYVGIRTFGGRRVPSDPENSIDVRVKAGRGPAKGGKRSEFWVRVRAVERPARAFRMRLVEDEVGD